MCVGELAWKFHFPNNTDSLQIICMCMLLIITFILHSYLLTTVYLTLVNAKISWNTTFTTIEMIGQSSTGPMELFFFLLRLKLYHNIMFQSVILPKPENENNWTFNV